MIDYVETPGEPGGVYVDQVRIVYRSIDGQTDMTGRATVVLISDAGMPIDRERLRHEVERLHYTPNPAGGSIHDSFLSEERLRTTSWGASGASLELFMWVTSAAVSGILGSAAYDGLKGVGKRLRDLHPPAWNPRPLDGRDAQGRASQMAQAAWPDLGEPLTVLSCNLDGDTATVVLRAPDGSTITAQPTITAFDAIGPITRAYPDPQ
ncbi:hypothetical protein [Mycobacterium sp. AZCC_0083]|uniref:hypothetical protein n=1 Tax=Mycobacterium sp. AZCC_0083 TaxID=2735882 RepID=UPI001609A7F9|nr:hypothetical protein [Mycobacterium sp. AZCC_0083]MBB5164938.1 hypothetical protein [Mycobacterium sp. AZCC_0083]